MGWKCRRSSSRGRPWRSARSVRSRATAASRIAWSNSSDCAPPAALARYIAASASRTSSAAPLVAPLNATPRLTVAKKSSSPSSENGRISSRRTRSVSFIAVCSSATPSNRITNSSPPKRATESEARTACVRRAPICCSSQSPLSCPRLSLTTLKRSTSMNTTATRAPLRRPRVSACSSRSLNSVRLGRPVSGSCSAWNSSASAASFWALTSWTWVMKCSGAPSSSRTSRVGDRDPDVVAVGVPVALLGVPAVLVAGQHPPEHRPARRRGRRGG